MSDNQVAKQICDSWLRCRRLWRRSRKRWWWRDRLIDSRYGSTDDSWLQRTAGDRRCQRMLMVVSMVRNNYMLTTQRKWSNNPRPLQTSMLTHTLKQLTMVLVLLWNVLCISSNQEIICISVEGIAVKISGLKVSRGHRNDDKTLLGVFCGT